MPLAPRFYLSIPIALIRQNYPNGLDGWIDEHAAMLGVSATYDESSIVLSSLTAESMLHLQEMYRAMGIIK